jgi:hypothetical protein
MDDISEFLVGPQHATTSGFGVVLTLIAITLAGALMFYLLRCYIQEGRIRKRIRQRSHQPFGGNIVPDAEPLPEARRPSKTPSIVLPPLHRDDHSIKVRRRSRGAHPWKQHHFHAESPTPH